MSAIVTWPNKDVAEVITYGVNWSKRLKGDTILTSTFTLVSGGVLIQSQDNTSTTSVVKISGGTVGQTAKLTCTITTAGGSTWRVDCVVKIVDRSA